MTNEKHCKLRWKCYTQQLVSGRCENTRIVLPLLQLATQHFVALQLQAAKMGVTGATVFATCNPTFVTLQVAGKIAPCNMVLKLLELWQLERIKARVKPQADHHLFVWSFYYELEIMFWGHSVVRDFVLLVHILKSFLPWGINETSKTCQSCHACFLAILEIYFGLF